MTRADPFPGHMAAPHALTTPCCHPRRARNLFHSRRSIRGGERSNHAHLHTFIFTSLVDDVNRCCRVRLTKQRSFVLRYSLVRRTAQITKQQWKVSLEHEAGTASSAVAPPPSSILILRYNSRTATEVSAVPLTASGCYSARGNWCVTGNVLNMAPAVSIIFWSYCSDNK